MKKTLEVINELERKGIIERYAIGGATALLFYAEPALTFDIDIFIYMPTDKNVKGFISLDSIYRSLESKGYKAEKEHVDIDGIPVQFIPVYNPLIEEAVEMASIKDYEGVKVKVLLIEHLLAIMIDTNRPKDRERINQLLTEISFDKSQLKAILKRHSLTEKWNKYIEEKE